MIEVKVDVPLLESRWYGLAQVGFTSMSVDQIMAKYRWLADQACALFLAAPDLLAALEAQAHLTQNGKEDETGRCGYCDQFTVSVPAYPEHHTEGCEWRIAQELTNAALAKVKEEK